MSTANAPLADRLKADTSAAHVRAERHPFQATMITGRLSAAGYAQWLHQMRIVHAALDRAITTATAGSLLSKVADKSHTKTHLIDADLATLAPVSTTPLASANHAASLSSTDIGAVGMFYVLEGSTNGGIYIARALQRALPTAGTSFLNPYGEAVRTRWQTVRDALNTLPAGAHDQIIAAATRTFDAITNLSEELSTLPDCHSSDGNNHGPVINITKPHNPAHA
ncbi:MAG: biliverdin-producing heme oxygenase [Planctomycetes bacterium]|nr:biliverdin-producing heme oxygenase [Planctomycetota bacterium]